MLPPRGRAVRSTRSPGVRGTAPRRWLGACSRDNHAVARAPFRTSLTSRLGSVPLRSQAHIKRRCFSGPYLDRRRKSLVCALEHVNAMRPGCELDHEMLTIGARPSIAIDRDVGVGWLNAKRMYQAPWMESPLRLEAVARFEAAFVGARTYRLAGGGRGGGGGAGLR